MVICYAGWGLKNPLTLFLRVASQVEIDVKTVGSITLLAAQQWAGARCSWGAGASSRFAVRKLGSGLRPSNAEQKLSGVKPPHALSWIHLSPLGDPSKPGLREPITLRRFIHSASSNRPKPLADLNFPASIMSFSLPASSWRDAAEVAFRQTLNQNSSCIEVGRSYQRKRQVKGLLMLSRTQSDVSDHHRTAWAEAFHPRSRHFECKQDP